MRRAHWSVRAARSETARQDSCKDEDCEASP